MSKRSASKSSAPTMKAPCHVRRPVISSTQSGRWYASQRDCGTWRTTSWPVPATSSNAIDETMDPGSLQLTPETITPGSTPCA